VISEQRDAALVRLGQLLIEREYQFPTITPESHRRVNSRSRNAEAHTLRDVLGWSRPFAPAVIPSDVLQLLRTADSVIQEGSLLRSRVRFSTSANQIFVHSAFPTTESNAVFFGPDTYRYLNLLRRLAPSAERVVDVGCGTGAGGIVLASWCRSVVLGDINERALRFARINAAINRVANADVVASDVLKGVERPFDLVVSNPPYLIDEQARLYRDGHGRFGEGLSVEIVRQSIERLEAGGRLILYTASAIVDGVDTFLEAIKPLVSGLEFHYEELDPDVFGEELERPIYGTVDRIAVVALDLRI
jgi:SAM-dependent methyltransferase